MIKEVEEIDVRIGNLAFFAEALGFSHKVRYRALLAVVAAGSLDCQDRWHSRLRQEGVV
jgi:hypothetical protein